MQKNVINSIHPNPTNDWLDSKYKDVSFKNGFTKKKAKNPVYTSPDEMEKMKKNEGNEIANLKS